MSDRLDDILDTLTRVSSELEEVLKATDPEQAVKVDPRFIGARVARWNEALAAVDVASLRQALEGRD